jgi:hypothetical protein
MLLEVFRGRSLAKGRFECTYDCCPDLPCGPSDCSNSGCQCIFVRFLLHEQLFPVRPRSGNPSDSSNLALVGGRPPD